MEEVFLEADTYQVPTLIYIFCVMSAMAFVVSGTVWMLRAYRTGQAPAQSYSDSVLEGQQDSFFCVIALSLFVGFYDYLFAGEPLKIFGEISVLILACAYLLYRVRRQGLNVVLTIRQSLRRALVFGGLCLLGWALTVAFGFVLWQVLSLLSAINANDIVTVIVFLTAGMWVLPIMMLGYKILRRDDARPALQGKSPHTFLWPVLLAYLILLVPLMVQQTANSDDWKMYRNAKRIKKI